MDENKKAFEEVNKQVEKKIEALAKEGVKQTNVDYLGKLIDIHKDIKEEENMMYRNYDNYGGYDNYAGGRRRDAMGRYTEGGNYGRRGRYRGEDALDEMKYHYGAYQDSHNAGNYNAKEDSSYKMMEAFKEFVYSVGEELEPKDKQMFKQAMQEMSQKLN